MHLLFMTPCGGNFLNTFALFDFQNKFEIGNRQCVRVVKESDSKSDGLCPQGFESPRCRLFCFVQKEVLAISKVSLGNDLCAAIAQSGERQTEDLEVPGSIPGLGTFSRSMKLDVSPYIADTKVLSLQSSCGEANSKKY